MLLMIDNYDSFTYNLVQYFGELGADVRVVRNDEASLAELESLQPERIVLSPGPCTPDQAGICLDVVQRFAGRRPILGVCLGHQVIGQAFGGQVTRARELVHGKVSTIHHAECGLFEDIAPGFSATRYHSLVIDWARLPECLEVTAWTRTQDGQRDEIMGIRHKDHKIVGVQFHPESILSEHGHRLLQNFLRL